VFHVGARALTSQALNIHAGHDDVMGVADCGWGILFARNAQEAADLTAIARRTAERAEVPFLVVQDGFLTTHTLEDISLPEDELLREFVGDPAGRMRDALDPTAALMTGVVENQDAYMKGRIGQRVFYDRLPGVLRQAMDEWAELTGRTYGPVRAYRCEDADRVLVSMGTLAHTAEAVVDALRLAGERVGALTITAFRPFPAAEIAAALGSARAVAVVERTDEPSAADNPLTREVKAALHDRAASGRGVPLVRSVAAGLGSRDVAAGDLAAVFRWLTPPDSEPRDAPAPGSGGPPDGVVGGPAGRFAVLGVRHPLALERLPLDVSPAGAYSMRGHSVGGFGSVTTNRLVATIAGEVFGLHVQAYPRYGSEKKGLPTTYYLTIAEAPIRQHSELERVDFVPVHDVAAFRHASPLRGLVDAGTLFLPSPLAEPRAIWASLPADDRTEILRRGIRVVALDSAALAKRYAPRPDLTVRMQGIALVGVFLRVSPFATRAGLDRDALLAAVRDRLGRFYGKRGAAVLDANLAVVAAAYDGLIDVTVAGGSRDA
jgi:pyruvate-ferredoxin/flavodoxin oxidoreductase